MKLITAIIIGVFTITSAIRVPTSWPKKQNVQQAHDKFRTTGRPSVGSEIGFQSRPHVVQMQKHNKINSGRKYQQSARRPNVKRPQDKKEFKASASLDEWRPVFPVLQQDKVFFKQPSFQNNNRMRPVQKSPTYKNYRDDRTHEPNYEEEIEERHIHREKPLSHHEIPLDIPTRPIYPGEGQWAKKDIKHKPFISKHRFTKPYSEDEDEEKPQGYETFQKNKGLFARQGDKYRENVDEFPEKHKLGAYIPHKEVEEEDDDDDDEEKQEFVPTKLYTQVRRSESEQHHPRLIEDPRLREVIKDSKIQTVYTEEGYEDLAYDHAGHEKTAEEDEGFAEFAKEIEKEKQKKALREKVENKEETEDDSETAGSQHESVKKPFKVRKGKLMKTEEVQTMSVKNKDDGNAELEVTSEVKTTEIPNNGTKTQKYVKIFPKVYRYDTTTVEPSSTTFKESTGASTTEIPQTSVETTTRKIYRSRIRRRFKRYTNDFPKITVDTDFIDKINHNLPQRIQKFEKPKYPYYNDPTINPYSPLRYAEDLDNIPKKTEDDLAFYHQADRIECAEVQTDVDPIPKRVKNADEDPENMEETTDVQQLVQGPRLRNLGDKIDCFKEKYFGVDPLDSPFFKEEEIGPVIPIFKVFKTANKQQIRNEIKPDDETRSYSMQIPVQRESDQSALKTKPAKVLKTEDLTILADIMNQFNKSKEPEATTTVQSAIKLKVIEPKTAETSNVAENQTEDAVISIITTPKYTIDLKPNHIYHQIELLEYLPQYNLYNQSKTDDINVSTTEAPSIDRMGKSFEDGTTEAAPDDESAPESQPLKHRRRRPRPRPGRPYFQVFDVNKYLPRNSFTLLNRIIRTSTVLPKDGKSEVHYKDDIKASEQLNVFADVINNIKNSSRDPELIAASSNRVAAIMNSLGNYRKIPVVEHNNEDIEETHFYTTTTAVAPRGTIKYSSYKTKELYEDLISRDKAKYENLELLKTKRLTTTEPYSSDTRISASGDPEEEQQEEEDEENEDTTEAVLGLMPPIPNRYKTIFPPKVKPVEETKMNLFYVLGMKPPSLKQKVYLYSDFKTRPHAKRKYGYLHRGKRSAQRPAYSEVVRNRNKPIDVDDETEVVVVEDDDDYVPHRPRNYHYDEKTGKIVYENSQRETEAPEEVYIEVTEAPLPKPTRRSSATTAKYEVVGPSFVDFIKKLKSDPSYQEIPDPTTTEKGEEVATTTTTVKPASTTPPAFLSFLSKLKGDANYQEIPDKTTAKTTTTTGAPLKEVEAEEEESQIENVKNSPGGQTISQMFQIFDINEYLPKVKNYTPTTSIDYSKYKTIERSNTPVRHSSRYNSDEEVLENVKPSKVPAVLEEQRKESSLQEGEINPVMSESKHEDVEPITTSTTTEAPSSITTSRRRTRTQPRGNRRSTTTASIATTTSPISEETGVPNSKAKRVYPRRRPSRIKLNRATTELPDSEIEESTSAKIVRRRHQRNEDADNKERMDKTTEEATSTRSTTTSPPPEVLNKLSENQTQSESLKIADVQVFQKYDESKKHGGNYQKEGDESESKKKLNIDVKRLTDVVPKPPAFYTDAKLPKKINQLMEGKINEEEIEDIGEEGGDATEASYDYEGEEKDATTKKPTFVKDPDKRMYYYVRV